MPLHQDLFVVVDLADRVIQGETTITLTATKPLLTNAPALRINCKRQCQIAQLSINGVACSHKVEDPLELIVPKDANQCVALAVVCVATARDECESTFLPKIALPLPPLHRDTAAMIFARLSTTSMTALRVRTRASLLLSSRLAFSH